MQQDWPHLIAAFQQRWNAPAHADAQALVDESRQYTYGQLHCEVGGHAGWLRSRGVRDGDRIAIAMERSSLLALTILGAMAAGACPCPLEPRLGFAEAHRRTRVAGFKWIVVDEAHLAEGMEYGLPKQNCLTYEGGSGVQPYWNTGIDELAASFLLFTSGSSGKPKGVLQNHRGMLTNAQGVCRHTGLGRDDKLLNVMPLYHTNGVNNQLLAPLLAGSCVVMATRFRAENMPELLGQHRPTILTGVPTMYARMLPLEFSPESLAKLRMLRCGSAPITEELHRRIEEKFGLPLVVSYGLSEATCTSTMNPPGARRLGSVGTSLQAQSVFLRQPDGKRVQQPGQEGEICISGPSLMTGYLIEGGDGTPEPCDEVLRTGDLGRLDEDGYLFITGRLKDVIIRGGENLSPTLIEGAIVTVSGVASCCVVGKTHADLGEVPVAFVVRQSDDSGASLRTAAIQEAVAKQLSRIHQPAEFIFVEALPENATGKVDRRKLRELAKTESGV